MKNQVILGDCLKVMKDIPDGSIDMILCDLPYGTTACKWDTIIPFEPLWKEYKRIIKDNGAIVLTASQPFTSALVMSNPKMFKYEWIWEKSRPNGYLEAKNKPMRTHENVLVFSKGSSSNGCLNRIIYNPQDLIKTKQKWHNSTIAETLGARKSRPVGAVGVSEFTNYPRTIIKIGSVNKAEHPTQKPVALFEYLIKTYTNEGDLVLDNCAGSFTTAIASENLKRNWICIEKEAEYCAIGEKRIKENRERLLNIDNKDLIMS
jgi:site-specific DNA-methyltransferase (adenine-specific)